MSFDNFDERVWEVLEAFEKARTETDYAEAKSLCVVRFRDAHDQMAFIDAAKEAFNRTKGVL